MRSLFALLSVFALGAAACTQTPPPCPAPKDVACPDPAPPECPEPTTKVVKVKQKCEPCSTRGKHTPEKTAPLTCVLGHVKTVGDMRMVVQRALVVVRHGDDTLAETFTDDTGTFAACMRSSALVEPVDAVIEVSKKPFNPVTLKTRLTRGQHREFQVGFEAEGLTN